jgi:ADP-ribosyl-[dinitrogen reductase] hydrolase
MALLLARTIVAGRGYDPEDVFAAYRWWLDSGPFDAGATISGALAGSPNPESQANGALMRVSPLGVFAAGRRAADTLVSGAFGTDSAMEDLARADARLTHVHENCAAVNVLFVDAIAAAIHGEGDGRILYRRIADRAAGEDIPREVRDWTVAAGKAFPSEYHVQQGWVRIAWQNALRQMLVVSDPVTGIRDTVRRGGDTDTNAAIAGALLGALYGVSAFPARWRTAISCARSLPGQPGVTHPRPPILWPVDWQELAAEVFLAGADCVLPARRQ